MPKSHITYPEGLQAQVGDIVTYHGERSTVEVVIVDELIGEWGVEEPGLMLQNATFGRVFIPVSGFDEDFAYVLLVGHNKRERVAVNFHASLTMHEDSWPTNSAAHFDAALRSASEEQNEISFIAD